MLPHDSAVFPLPALPSADYHSRLPDTQSAIKPADNMEFFCANLFGWLSRLFELS
jgi:hypothetical protein